MTELQEIVVKRIDGSETTLGAYAGEVLLVVNVASRCGMTPQYESLETLYREYRGQGFQVLGFPCNQFLGQEPGDEAEIASFCESRYGIDFPLFRKIEVNGPARHPLYAALTGAMPEARVRPDSTMRARLAARGIAPGSGDVLWNFEKFLISRDGIVVGRFAPDLPPDDAIVLDALKTQLGR